MPFFTPPTLYRKVLHPVTTVYPTRFKELLPLKLRNQVAYNESSKAVEKPETCVQQMTELFECFKKNEFSQSMCAKEISAFKACNDMSMSQEKNARVARKAGTLVPGAERLTTRQVNVLLKRFPQHNPNVPDRWPR